ncbi:MAG: hypothetical protein IT160_14740 [Bryobacterales bacterium]|nr:hypothetical protein [Bryobacterales bacterium]
MHPPGGNPVRHGIRHALLIGLGSVLALLAALGVYASRSLSSVSETGALTTREYFQQSELLENIEALLWDTTSSTRDYLLDPDSIELGQYRTQAETAWKQARKAIDEYQLQAQDDLKPLARRLAMDAERYGQLAARGLKLAGAARARQGVDLMIGKLVPAREKLFATIAEIGMRNRANLRTEADNADQFVQRAERRLGAVVAVIVVLALLMAATTMFYLTRLENAAVAQYQASLRANRELERLSRRLLTLQEDERQKIARELHDDYGQRMASVLFELSAINENQDLAAEVKATVQSVEAGLRSLARDLQQLSRSLHSAVLDKIGLEAAIRSDCALLQKRADWEIRFESSGVPRRLPEPLNLAIYRVFQEAIQNVLKHAQTRQALVTLAIEQQELVLRVKDYGHGFDPNLARQTASLGLVSMRERLHMVDGRLLIRSGKEEGTEIEARIPVPAAVESPSPVA